MHSELPSRIRRRVDGGRQGHLMTLMGTEWDGWVYFSDIYVSAGSFLAVHHLNQRSGAVLPELPALMEGCDFEFTFEQRETSYDPVVAVQELVNATTDPRELHSDNSDKPSQSKPIVELVWNND